MDLLRNINKVSLNFNLREPKGNKATIVYAVVKIERIQFKFSTGCKVNCWEWDKRRQMPIVNNCMTEESIANNLKVIRTLSLIRMEFLENISYLCTSSLSTVNGILREFFYKTILSNVNESDMNNKNLRENVTRTPRATTLLEKAFDIYYRQIRPTTKQTSVNTERDKLNSFINYCIEKGNKKSLLTQKGLNDYQRYLTSKTNNSNKQINNKCKAVVKLVNKVLSTHNDFLRYEISKVDYINLEEVKTKGEDKKRRPLNKEEIEKLLMCENLSNKEREYRDLFILECYAGYRVSDTPKLFNKSLHKHYKKDDNEYLTIVPKKEETKNIIAVIWLNDKTKEILKRYENGFKYVNIRSQNYGENLNRSLKNICRKAGLDSKEKWVDANNERQTDYLYNIISSHFARYTFVYNGLFTFGFTPEELKDFTGHASDKMINEVYNVISTQDLVNDVDKAIKRVTDKASPEMESKTILPSNPLNELFAYDSLLHINELSKQNIDIFHMDATQQAIKVVKDLSTLGNFSKKLNMDKVVDLDRLVFELSYYFHDTQLYSIFQYKEKYFGIIDYASSTEDVEIMFAERNIKYQKDWEDFQIELYENGGI